MWSSTLWLRRSYTLVFAALPDTGDSWRLANTTFPTTPRSVSEKTIHDTTQMANLARFSCSLYRLLIVPCCCGLSVGMAVFLKNVSFHGILLDALFDDSNQDWHEVYQLLKKGIEEGVVRPLKTTVFKRDQVEEAFRYMAQGKHIGKVVLQVSAVCASLL